MLFAITVGYNKMRGGEGRRKEYRGKKRNILFGQIMAIEEISVFLFLLLPLMDFSVNRNRERFATRKKNTLTIHPSIYRAHCKSEQALATNDEKLVEAGGSSKEEDVASRWP